MKSTIIAVLLIAAFTTTTQAQLFTLGPKAGLNFSRIEISNANSFEDYDFSDLEDARRTGAVAGAFLQLNLGPFVFQPEALYSQDKGNLKIKSVNFEDVKAIQFDKIDVPLLAGFNLGKAVRVLAGPVMTYTLSAGLEPGIGNVTEAFIENYDRKTWGYQLGGGLDLGRLAIDFRWGGDFSKHVLNLDIDGSSMPVDYKRKMMQVTLGLALIK